MITVVIITYHTRIVDNIDGSPKELKCACSSRISAVTLISPSLTGPDPCGTLDSGTNDVTGPSFPLWIQKKTPSTPWWNAPFLFIDNSSFYGWSNTKFCSCGTVGKNSEERKGKGRFFDKKKSFFQRKESLTGRSLLCPLVEKILQFFDTIWLQEWGCFTPLGLSWAF